MKNQKYVLIFIAIVIFLQLFGIFARNKFWPLSDYEIFSSYAHIKDFFVYRLAIEDEKDEVTFLREDFWFVIHYVLKDQNKDQARTYLKNYLETNGYVRRNVSAYKTTVKENTEGKLNLVHKKLFAIYSQD